MYAKDWNLSIFVDFRSCLPICNEQSRREAEPEWSRACTPWACTRQGVLFIVT